MTCYLQTLRRSSTPNQMMNARNLRPERFLCLPPPRFRLDPQRQPPCPHDTRNPYTDALLIINVLIIIALLTLSSGPSAPSDRPPHPHLSHPAPPRDPFPQPSSSEHTPPPHLVAHRLQPSCASLADTRRQKAPIKWSSSTILLLLLYTCIRSALSSEEPRRT